MRVAGVHAACSIGSSSAPARVRRQLKFGFVLHGVGAGWGDWRHEAAVTDASVNFGFYREQAQLAEQAKFELLFVADSVHITERSSPHDLNRFEPPTILSALAAVTTQIGLVGTVTASYSEPFTVAPQFASLDHISKGRAAWNVVTTSAENVHGNFGRDAHPDPALRYEPAHEFVDVVKGLWDSFEDDAFVRDRESGVYFDPAKLHELNHIGKHFKVKGPLSLERSPQGHPVIVQAGQSEPGRELAARTAEVVCFYFSASEILFPPVSETPIWKLVIYMLLGFTLLPAPATMDIRGWGEMHPLNGPAWSLFFEYNANIFYAFFLRRLSTRILSILTVLAGVNLIYFAVSNPNGDVIGGWSITQEQLYVGFTRLLFPFLAGLVLSRIYKPIRIKYAFLLSSLL